MLPHSFLAAAAAFRAVKAIKSAAVWGNMAHLCIKNKRLDVAEHCLGKMENARGARAAREARSIAELDARVASVAVHLGMVEDAKKMYVAADRFDLLNKLYRASGAWDKALEIAEKHDRIHLKVGAGRVAAWGGGVRGGGGLRSTTGYTSSCGQGCRCKGGGRGEE
eukprot:290272-Chlamydomonas_euryale.AAC.2